MGRGWRAIAADPSILHAATSSRAEAALEAAVGGMADCAIVVLDSPGADTALARAAQRGGRIKVRVADLRPRKPESVYLPGPDDGAARH